MKKRDKIKDIYSGKIVDVLGDDETVHLQFPFGSIMVFRDDWEIIKGDLKNISETE